MGRDAAPDDAEATARNRVRDVLDQLGRTNVGVLVVSLPGADGRAARERAQAAAREAGRMALLTEATAAAGDLAIRAFAGAGFSGTWAASEMAVSVSSARDRVAVATAFEDAAVAAVVEDLVDADTIGRLRATWDELDLLKDVPTPGALSELASSAGVARGGPLRAVVLIVAFAVVGLVGLATGTALGIGLFVLAIALIAGTLGRR